MEVLSFVLKGRMAHFKNPENNLNIELTYSNIHKPALLGLLGAVIGLKGRNQYKELGYIEYYKELKDLEIAIVPYKPYWNKFIDELTNTTGFANKQFNQIIKRQYLENVSWNIYIRQNTVKDELWQTLKFNLLNGISYYHISLGGRKNTARIERVEILEDKKVDKIDYCDSIIKFKNVNNIFKDTISDSWGKAFCLKENMPIGLEGNTLYNKEDLIFTSNKLTFKQDVDIYKVRNNYVSYM